ncbi:MAG: stress responsive alpha-beta barrel domain-containing protein [Deltaproteobacteria bacterium HGW-Deltaproteobacteria-19]|nr:MAG: stress responsive alpha-beta barrel domain-containing protein [Deltaproteobacteria bacterium HGW-Deltaproteobacteria-19]
MLRHIVFVKFKAGVTAAQVEEMKKALGGLPGKIAEIRGWAFGPDILRTERSVDFALVADFENVEALKRYQVHPDHIPVLTLVRSLSEVLQVADFNLQ